MCAGDQRPMTRKSLVLALLAVALLGCSSSAQRVVAEKAVSRFHEMLDAGRFAEIYATASDEFKKVSTQSDFVALLSAVHRKLGNMKSSVNQGWNVSYLASGTFVTLNYKTVYSGGEAAEQFMFHMQDDSAVLVGYHISSNALIIT
jgi:opacity protein-like surface antigen